MPNSVSLKIKGLYAQPNNLSEVPDGALTTADNIVIDRDSIAEPRRGFSIYGDSLGSSSDRAKQLRNYKNRILRHFTNKLQYDNGSGTFASFKLADLSTDASISEVESGLRIKSVEQNGNLYITTSSGIKKIAALYNSSFNISPVTDAGGVKSLDLATSLSGGAGSVIPDGSAIAHRVVWGITDANSNLVLGTPSPRSILQNTSGMTKDVILEFPIPQEITTAYFYQVYRTATVSPATSDPGDEMQLVYEDNPTTTDISNGYITVTDDTPDDFKGADLYTNAISGEGILQANEQPPLAKDIATFKSSTFYANTKTKHRKTITLLGVSGLTDGVSTFTISDGTTSNTYTFDAVENVATKTVYKSTSGSPATAVDETARSLVKVINRQASELVYAYYLSGDPDSLPGKILLESRALGGNPFFINTNSTATGDSFTPTLAPKTITAISAANPTVITSALHSLTTGDSIIITGSDSTPSINGVYTVTITGANTFTIPVNVTVAGTTGLFTKEKSDNEISGNRIFYSKYQQPEAVPLLNYFDVGPKDEPILRILPLRDSLFVLKATSVWRVTGESTSSFSVTLFDNATALIAPDTAASTNNQIFLFTEQGIATISDTGVSVISRPIENLILKFNSPQYTNFSTASFGLGYESDRSYLIWTVTETSDTYATQCFRFNTFTNSWVRWTTSKTCGIVGESDSTLYLGASDINYIEKERKSFSRFDHADREYTSTIPQGGVDNVEISLSSLSNIEVGDAIIQRQYLTIYQYNSLLKRLDADLGVNDTDYFSTLQTVPGDDLETSLLDLATKLDADGGLNGGYITAYNSVSNPDALLQEQLRFNAIVVHLIADIGVANPALFNQSVGHIDFEMSIIALNSTTSSVTILNPLPFIAGDINTYSHIATSVVWAPQTMGDVTVQKQIREASTIFETTSFTRASVSYSSDLSPGFDEIEISGTGNGQWGFFNWGDDVWGGGGSSIPLRTYIPLEKQRCRFIRPKMQHSIALESYALQGMSLVFEPLSNRAYR